MRGSLFALLADIAALEAGLGVEVLPMDLSAAKEFFHRALEAYGAALADEDEARLTTLRAKLDYLSGDRDAALALVDGRTDPPCLSLRLSILIDLARYDEADRAVEGVPPHEKWCDRAVTARIMSGNRAGADELLTWAKGREDASCFHRSLLACAQAVVAAAFGGAEAARRARPNTITDGQRTALVEALALLQPLLRPAEDLGRTGSGLEVEGHTIAVRIAILIGDTDRRSRSAGLLATATPVPFEFANAAIRGDVPTPEDLPTRLRRHHPRSLEAQILAAMVEARRLDRADDAYSALAAAIDLARTAEQKLEFCSCLLELSTAASSDRTEESLPFIREVLGDDHPFTQLAETTRLIESDDMEGAGRILAEHDSSDDPLWLQLSAKKKLKQGDREGAVEDLIAAGQLLGSVDLLRSAAGMARSVGQVDRERLALESLLALEPGELNAREALAMNLLDGQEYRRAAAELATLRELGVTEKAIIYNHGVALCNSGRAREALTAYRELAASHPDWLPGVRACAQLLHVLGHSDEAFQLLHASRDRFWSVPGFLMPYINLGHAAAREEEAGEGLRRLIELERPDQGTSSVIKLFPIEQLKQMARERFEDLQDIDRKLLEGRFSWVLAGALLGRLPSRDWSYRTQPLNVGDHPLARAEFGVYATNGFRVGEDEEPGRNILVRTECPPPGTPVVADLTSLITLDRIGALDEALGYFGKVIIPASYLPELLYEQGRLRPIQPSRLAGLRAIRDAADRGRILTLGPGEAGDGGMTHLHEYGEPDEPGGFGVIDVAGACSPPVTSGPIGSRRSATRRGVPRPPMQIRSAL